MQFQTIVTSFNFNSLGYGQYLPLPDEVYSEMIKVAPDKRVRCMFGDIEHYCAMMPKDGSHFIMINKPMMTKLGWAIGDTVTIQIEKQELKYGIPITEEMEEVLNTDYEGSEYFYALKPGAQRSLIHVINKYKSSQLRIDRSIILLQHLVLRKGNLDFKILQQNFKDGL
jgi:Domain of unknown function (DUF1905)